jgi:hypothetical protein
VRFTGILTLTHNGTSLILPTAANITTAAGDAAIMKYEGSGNWRCINYSRASGLTVKNAGANSVLLGAGASGSGAPYAELTLGTNLSMSGTTLNAAGGGVKAIQYFTASGTYTPTSGAPWAIIFSQGGGGGGGGGNGGNTTVGSVATGSGAAGQTGGAASNGTVNLTGGNGGPAPSGSAGGSCAWTGGGGAPAKFLGAPGFGSSGSTGTNAAANSGSGGGGNGGVAVGASGATGGGAGGLAIRLYDCSSGAQTVTIGTGGTGSSGGNGGSGYVLVFEF